MNNSGGFISIPSEDVDNTLSLRKHILEEGKEDVGIEYVLIPKLIHPKKRAKARKMYLLKTSVNSLISEDHNCDEEDNAKGTVLKMTLTIIAPLEVVL